MKTSFIHTVFALSLPFATLIACGTNHDSGVSLDPNQPSIVNGQTVKAGDPLASMTVALIIQNDQGVALCSGSLIADDTVLTAAHCLDDNPGKVAVVFAHDVASSNDTDRRAGDTFVQNPNWKGSAGNALGDLALVHFNGGLPSGYTTVTLLNSDIALKAGATVTLIGYGVTDGLSHAGVGVLRETKTEIKDILSPTQVVTDGSKTSVCFGDSGGPAFIKSRLGFVQWGVASAVMSDTCKTTSVHTSVVSYLDWITQAAANLRKN